LVGRAVGRETIDKCDSSTCVCRGIANPVCTAVLSFMNKIPNEARSYGPVRTDWLIASTNSECRGPYCQASGVPISFCTP
jgi:hypothetical protein